MHCRKCDQKAVINMRHHRLSLCRRHFLEWVPEQTLRFIKKYDMFTQQEKILVAVSGGKDSLGLWDILWQLGYQADGLYIDLGIDNGTRYSEKSRLVTESFAAHRRLNLIIVDVQKSFSLGLSELQNHLTRLKDKPCSVCGMIKRHIFNQTAVECGYDVVATAHNLDDEAAILLSNVLDWSLDFLARRLPVLPASPGFVKKVKPFCRLSERESAAYALLKGIDYIHDECPFSKDNKQLMIKDHLNQLEDRMPGTKLRFYVNYVQAIEKGAFPDRQETSEELAAKRCPICGQPTTTGGLCTFCRLVDHNSDVTIRKNGGA